MSPNKKQPLVIIAGPTAVGKTSTAIALASSFDAEIISADSRQIYRRMNIGTAKPTPEELAAIRHHLIDIIEPNDAYSLACFKQDSENIIREISDRKKIPFMAGGTGQYIHAIVHGWIPPDMDADENYRQNMETVSQEKGKEFLHAMLREIDPEAAAMIDYRNARRVIRALEVFHKTGVPFSQQRQRGETPYQIIQIGLTRSRSELYQRIDNRIENMLRDGLIDETRQLLDEGIPPHTPALSAIGYREMVAFLNREITLEEAVCLIKRNTRNYVRRQANWFKLSDPEIQWFDMTDNPLDEIKHFLNSKLNNLT